MAHRLHDPSLDVVRSDFLENVSRFCLLVALANFICIFPLFFLYAYDPAAHPMFVQYTTLLTVVGIALTVLGLLCRYQNLATLVAKLCVAFLYLEACYLLYHVKTLEHPVLMIFPILCFVTTPILGLRSPYVLGTSIILALGFLHFFVFGNGFTYAALPGFALVVFAIAFCSHASFLLWRGVLRREKHLKDVIAEIEKRSDEINQWVNRLNDSSRNISQGNFAQALPDSPPTDVLGNLSANIAEMQQKLSTYLSELLLKDRLDSIGLLASGLAHELNTPLTSMRFIVEGMRGKLPAETIESLDEELIRMGGITREFLNFASPHQHGEVIDLNELVRMSVSLLSKLKKGRVEVVSNLSAEALPVEATKNHIEQVVLNLFKNAADSMEGCSDPKFTIHTSRLPTGEAAVSFVDNGKGVEPENISKIMNPFFTTKPMGKGFGLGLYIVQQIVHQHSGSIHVQSTKNEGTTITLKFPLKAIEPEMTQRKAA